MRLKIYLVVIILLFILFSNCQTEFPGKFEIVSIKNDTSMNGNFFLFSGYIGEKEYYYAFVKENGFIRRVVFDPSIVYIKEVEGIVTPYMEVEITNPFEVEKINTLSDLDYKFKNGIHIIVKMYLPENTIIKKMEIK